VAVLDRTLPKTRTGRIWTYVGDGKHPTTVYDYTATRKREGPEAFLKDYRGYLQADAYAGYDRLYKEPDRGVVEVACWAHSRRKVYESRTSDLARAAVGLAYIGLLYKIERKAREWSAEERYALRQRMAVPVLEEFRVWMERERGNVLPKSPLGGAIAYTLSNWAALCRYCEDGDLAIDNNASERSLRGVEQPGARHRPIPLHRPRRDLHHLGGFLHGEPGEATQFHDTRLLRVEFAKPGTIQPLRPYKRLWPNRVHCGAAAAR
jgi:transposase